MSTPDPTRDLGPAPDLSNYDTSSDEAYEWLLSDHPWAVAERRRRSARYHAEEQERAEQVRAWVAKIDRLEPGTTSRGFESSVRRLADQMGPLADKTSLRSQIDEAVPVELSVLEERRRWEINQNVSGKHDDDYTYPEHLTGPAAAAFPPPASGFTTPTNSQTGQQPNGEGDQEINQERNDQP